MSNLPTPTPVNLEGSQELRSRIRPEPQACWKNSIIALRVIEELAEAVYVEGWSVTQEGLVIEHGWLEFDGAVLEPTVEVPFKAYFPGVRYTLGTVKWFMGGRWSRTLPFVGYGPERSGKWADRRAWNVPAYVRAYVAADQWFYRHVMQLEEVPEWVSGRWNRALADLR